MAKELAQLDINIVALSKVHFAEQDSLMEGGESYTLFWSGKNKDKCCHSGVSFRIKTSTARKLQNLPIGHSDRLMSLIYQIQDNKFATVISVYAPILQAEIGLKEAFHCDLQLTQRTSSHLRRLEAFYCDLQLTPRTSSHLTRLQCKSEMRFQFQNMAGNPRLTRNWQLQLRVQRRFT